MRGEPGVGSVGRSASGVDARFSDEERFLGFGLLRDIVVSGAYTHHGNTIRIISMRKATPYERKKFFERIGH